MSVRILHFGVISQLQGEPAISNKEANNRSWASCMQAASGRAGILAGHIVVRVHGDPSGAVPMGEHVGPHGLQEVVYLDVLVDQVEIALLEPE